MAGAGNAASTMNILPYTFVVLGLVGAQQLPLTSLPGYSAWQQQIKAVQQQESRLRERTSGSAVSANPSESYSLPSPAPSKPPPSSPSLPNNIHDPSASGAKRLSDRLSEANNEIGDEFLAPKDSLKAIIKQIVKNKLITLEEHAQTKRQSKLEKLLAPKRDSGKSASYTFLDQLTNLYKENDDQDEELDFYTDLDRDDSLTHDKEFDDYNSFSQKDYEDRKAPSSGSFLDQLTHILEQGRRSESKDYFEEDYSILDDNDDLNDDYSILDNNRDYNNVNSILDGNDDLNDVGSILDGLSFFSDDDDKDNDFEFSSNGRPVVDFLDDYSEEEEDAEYLNLNEVVDESDFAKSFMEEEIAETEKETELAATQLANLLVDLEAEKKHETQFMEKVMRTIRTGLESKGREALARDEDFIESVLYRFAMMRLPLRPEDIPVAERHEVRKILHSSLGLLAEETQALLEGGTTGQGDRLARLSEARRHLQGLIHILET